MKRPFKLTWRKDTPDSRDLVFNDRTPLSKLPNAVDLTPLCSPVENQGTMGSCTGHAVTAAVELIQTQETGRYHHLSRLFVYYNGRNLDGWPQADDGATIRSCIKSTNKLGAPPEKDWRYLKRNLLLEPPSDVYKKAAELKVVQYSRIQHRNINNIRRALAQGLPVVFGFEVFESFMSDRMSRTGVMTLPEKGETSDGGHAVVAVGYDDSRQRLIVRNSWGRDWGVRGYFYMPYVFVTDPKYCADFWTLY